MSFSFRSMFLGASNASQKRDPASREAGSDASSENTASPYAESSVSAPPLNSISPMSTPLFKTVLGENHLAQPVRQSPFSVTPSAGTGSPLTVGDVITQLPPEMARAGALPMDQPVAVSAQALDEALRGGQASLPIFEIYRVCPALFQTPVSPQDPRMIPLPASKLPRLIAATQPGAMLQNSHMGAAPSASPFGMASAAPASPPPSSSQESQPLVQPSFSGMMLPPKRQGPPPPLADIPCREAAMPQLSLPGQQPLGAAPVFPTSPFSASTGVPPSLPNPAVSPFGAMPSAAVPAPAPAQSLVSFGQSPFAEASHAPSNPLPKSGVLSSPFAAAPRAGTPTGQESPFSVLFGNKAVPTGQLAPDGSAEKPACFSMPGFPSSQPVTSSAQVRISLAALLKGYTAAELGFDPMVVPGWITLSMPAQKVQELASSSAPISELGTLVDAITDAGFRHVLNTAKRDFQLRLPREELQSALSSGAPPSLPNFASLGTPPPLSPAPAAASAPAMGGVIRVETPAAPQGNAHSPYAPLAPMESSSVPGTNSPFLAPSAASAASSPAFAPAAPTAPAEMAKPSPSLFTSAASQFGPAQPFPISNPGTSMFSAPAPVAESAPQSQPLSANSSATFQPEPTQAAAPASPLMGFAAATPFFQPAPAKAHDPFGAFIPAAPVSASLPEVPACQPPVGAAPFSFAAPAPSYSPPPAEIKVLPPQQSQDYTPPPGVYSFSPPKVNEGFSSDQLLGREVSPPRQPERSFSNPSADDDFQRDRYQVPQKAQSPSSFFDAEVATPASTPKVSAFVPTAYEDDGDQASAAKAKPQPVAAKSQEVKAALPASAPRSVSVSPNLGVQMHNTDPDQILLRALLGTDSDLSPQNVVEMTCALPGIAACVCIHGQESFSHVVGHKPQAREFQRQATDLAQHLKTLAPLIGIEGAETFTMNSGDRLMTFCFPEGAILGVLHDTEPTLGLRDKITLIARELSRMVA